MFSSPRRAVLYGRVSADRSEGRSVDSQLAESRRVAEREGWSVLAEHRDDGISASRYARGAHRPGWQDVMALLAGGGVDVLVVWEVSRATRDRTVWAALVAACTDARVLLAVGGRVHDPSDPDDGFMLDLGAALAVRESSATSKRTTRALNARAEAGDPHGRVPYGYRRTYDAGSGALSGQVPDEDTAPVVRELVARVLAGESLRALAADLTARGVPSPLAVTRRRACRADGLDTPWRPEQVARIVRSPTIAGMRVLRGQVVPGVTARWEPLVTLAEHRAIGEVFSRPTRFSRTPDDRDSSPRYLLVGIGHCGVCDRPLAKLNNRGVLSYTCRPPRGQDGFHVARAMTPVDDTVTAVLLARLEEPDAAVAFADPGDDQQRERARAEVAELRAELDGWYAAGVAGQVTPAGVARVERGLLERIEDAERRAIPRPSSPVLGDALAAGPRAWWSGAPLRLRRELVRIVLVPVLHPVGRGRRTFDPESVEIRWRTP